MHRRCAAEASAAEASALAAAATAAPAVSPTALAPLFLLGVLVVDDPGGVEQVAGERVRVALARLVAASEGWAEAPLLRRRVAPQEGRLRGMCQLVARRAAELWTVVRSIEKELLVVGC